MKEWQEVSLGSVANIISQKTAITNATLDNYISTDNMLPYFGGIRKAEKLPNLSTINCFSAGDILFSNIRTYFKKVWYSTFDGTVSADVLVFRTISSSVMDNMFLYLLLCSPEFTEFTVLTSKGAKMPRGDKEAIKSYNFMLPSLPEQKAIAGVLSSLDDKIDLLHRQNQTLEAMAETLFRQWFIDKECQSRLLGDCITTTSGGTPSRKKDDYYLNGEFLWFKSKELNGGYLLNSEEKITTKALNNSSAKKLPKNAVLIAMYGATVGEYAILGQESTCNQAICACIPNDKCPYTFIYFVVKHNKEELINRAVGSAQQNISQVLIKSISIPYHEEKIQKFHKIVSPIMEKIHNSAIEIKQIQELRDILLPKLMNGEIRVDVK